MEDTRLPEDIAPGPAAEERDRREVPGAWPAPAPSWLCLILLIGMVGGLVPSDRLIITNFILDTKVKLHKSKKCQGMR